MAGVFINIPGVGNIEAKNAATEATLKDILKALQGKGSAGATSAGAAASSKAVASTTAASMAASRALSKFSGTAGLAAGKLLSLALNSGQVIKAFADVGDSVTAASNVFSGIPVIGSMFQAVASAAEKTTTAYQSAAAAGATFGGSISQFAGTASAAGLTMEKFGALIKANAEGMLGFGATTEDGAKRFAQVSKQLRNTSNELYALGFSTEDINNGLAKYGQLLKLQGLQGTQTNAQMAAGAKNYLRELDALAKITGVERQAKEAEIMAALKDAQFQGAMANQTKEVRDSFLNTLGGLAGGIQGPLGNFAKDILATGTATTEENQKLMAMMPQSAKMLQDLRAKMQRGEAVSEEERNRLNNLMASEGTKAAKQMGGTFAAAPEFAQTMNALTLAQSMQQDALKQATAEQKKAAKETDGQNKLMEKAKQDLAALSNSFQMVLAQSGILPVMIDAFKVLAGLVQTFIVPTFKVLSTVVSEVFSGLTALFSPFDAIVRASIVALKGLWEGVSGLFAPLKALWGTVDDLVVSNKTLIDVVLEAGDFLGGVFKFLGKAAELVIEGLTWLSSTVITTISSVDWLTNAFTTAADGIKKGWDVLKTVLSAEGASWLIQSVKDFFQISISNFISNLQDQFELFFINILEGIPNALGGISKEEAEQRRQDLAAAKEARLAEAAERESYRNDLAKAAYKETENRNERLADEKKAIAQDTKAMESKKFHLGKLGGLQKEEEDLKKKSAESSTKDYSDSVALLGSELKSQGLLPNAEAAKKDLESKAQAEQKAKEEAQRSSGTTANAPASGTATNNEQRTPVTRESAETLLTQLNSKLDQLIRVTTQLNDLNERQLRVQQSLTGDLFVAV